MQFRSTREIATPVKAVVLLRKVSSGLNEAPPVAFRQRCHRLMASHHLGGTERDLLKNVAQRELLIDRETCVRQPANVRQRFLSREWEVRIIRSHESEFLVAEG